MNGIIEALGFEALPTAIIIALSGAVAFYTKRMFSGFNKSLDGRFSKIEDKLNELTANLNENIVKTTACTELSKVNVLEKMRFYVDDKERTEANDKFFAYLYTLFEEYGDGFDEDLKQKWFNKPFKKEKN